MREPSGGVSQLIGVPGTVGPFYSENLLLSEGLGLPRLKETILIDGPQVGYVAEPGSETFSTPVLRLRPMIRGTRIHQANIHREFITGPLPEMFTTEHVRSMFDSVETGIGKVLVEGDNRVLPYPYYASEEWVQKHRYTLKQLLGLLPFAPVSVICLKLVETGSSLRDFYTMTLSRRSWSTSS